MKRIDVAIGIVLRGGEILIARRKANDSLGGYWEFPGGKVEPGETVPAALLRELREETGLSCEIVEPLPPFEHAYPQITVRLHPFMTRPLTGEPQALDSDEIRWIRPADLTDYRFPPANADLLRQLQARLRAD